VTSPFAGVLGEVSRVRGVIGAMVVDETDGVVVDAAVQTGMRVPAVAALAASLYRKARLSAEAAGFGAAGFMELEADDGRLCVVGRGGLVLVVVAESRAAVGLVRVAMLAARGALA
jgi:predicted regulator of Ras-like GTPase activity (Roadblock/LC7/MglB family)